MKHTKLRQLIREIIKEAYVDPKGQLKKFNADEFSGLDQEMALWISGVQRGFNLLKSAPQEAEVQKHINDLKIIANQIADILGWSTEEEIKVFLDKIPGDDVETKGIMAMVLGAYEYFSEQGDGALFDVFVFPHVQNKLGPELFGLMEGNINNFKRVLQNVKRTNLFRKLIAKVSRSK